MEQPYIEKKRTVRLYNKNYGDDRICVCGHFYYRHFDTYNDMENVGCKYCGCNNFIDAATIDQSVGWWKSLNTIEGWKKWANRNNK